MIIDRFWCEKPFIHCRTAMYSLKKIINFSVKRNVWSLSQNVITINAIGIYLYVY